MPDRIVRDELLESTRWLDLPSCAERLAFVALLLIADDFGNLEADAPRLLRLWRDVAGCKNQQQAELWLDRLAAVDLVRTYEVDGKRYVHLPRFKQRLRFPTHACPLPQWQADTYVPDITGSEWRKRIRPMILQRDGHKCALCGSTGFLHVDHALPLAAGGRSTIDNLITLCRKCNVDKSRHLSLTADLLLIIKERNSGSIDPQLQVKHEEKRREEKGSSSKGSGFNKLPTSSNGARARKTRASGRRAIRETPNQPSGTFIDRWWTDEQKTRQMAEAVGVPNLGAESWADWRHRIFQRIAELKGSPDEPSH